jgi:K+/H+ antiporter YhaU regulatory subunit KhtT
VSDIDLTGAYGAQLLAIRLPDKGAFIPNPTPDAMVQLGTTLIVLGEAEQIAQVRRLGHD